MAKTIVSISGPTAVGKTALAIEVAQQLGCDIISFDSRQVYRELEIGVARPSREELEAVKHHFIAHKSIIESYTVHDFVKESHELIDQLFQSMDYIVLCGGTGLFLNALRFGINDLPQITDAIRNEVTQLAEEGGLEALQAEVQRVDPESYDQIDRYNMRRLQRVLEVYRASGIKMSAWQKKEKELYKSYHFKSIVLDRDRNSLYERIDARVDLMIAAGLEQEVQSVSSYSHLPSMQTVGYKEWFSDEYGTDRMQKIDKIKQHSRNYAKRQLTWFRKFQADDLWLNLSNLSWDQAVAKAINYIKVSQ